MNLIKTNDQTPPLCTVGYSLRLWSIHSTCFVGSIPCCFESAYGICWQWEKWLNTVCHQTHLYQPSWNVFIVVFVRCKGYCSKLLHAGHQVVSLERTGILDVVQCGFKVQSKPVVHLNHKAASSAGEWQRANKDCNSWKVTSENHHNSDSSAFGTQYNSRI